MKVPIGKKFGRWTVLGFAHKTKATYFWKCKCDCGIERAVRMGDISNGKSVSCGCFSIETQKRIKTIHGQAGNKGENSKEYNCWKAIKYRCYARTGQDWPDYGGRGIEVCSRWFSSFNNFFEDMGKKPSNRHSIERKDVNKDYCKENCMWATPSEQANNKRCTLRFEFDGKNMTLSGWSDLTGVSRTALYTRIRNGWTLHRTFTTPKLHDK